MLEVKHVAKVYENGTDKTVALNDVSFKMTLDLYGSKKFYIALCYPWSFEDNEKYIIDLENRISKRKDIYYNR